MRYNQREIKLVLFSPSPDNFAVDIYVDGERVHCGRGHFWETAAIDEARQWLNIAALNIKLTPA